MLVQLLQGGTLHLFLLVLDCTAYRTSADESEELAAVKQSLVEHVQIDARAALGVLCDHMMHTSESDVNQVVGRGDLMGLVLTFLAQDAHAALLDRVTSGDSLVEALLRDGLLKVCFLEPHPL